MLTRTKRLVVVLGVAFATGALSSCTDQQGDAPAAGTEPPSAGKGARIRDVRSRPGDPEAVPTKADITGAVVLAVDRYDETGDGKSSGTVYVADIDLYDERDTGLARWKPYSGISLYNPSFIPGNLRVSPGDTLDLRGSYQENRTTPVTFATGSFLPQLSTPIATFRFESQVPPAATPVPIADLATFDAGAKWMNMLVTIEDIETGDFRPSSSGRMSVPLFVKGGVGAAVGGQCTEPFPKTPTLVNELTDLSPIVARFSAPGTRIKRITGVVTFFCNLHIAPRSLADVVFDE